MVDQEIFVFIFMFIILAATFVINHIFFHDLKYIDGPRSFWPTGQLLDKFLNGEDKAHTWKQRYGSVYRVRSLLTPEVYVASKDPASSPIAYNS